ncbi:MBL fold metallo-hydrolase [Pseudomonas abietaniphila]
MDQLIALPVSGDAFLLRRADRVILVDGGRSSAVLSRELTKYGVDRLDVVICTHADHDHAGGLVDLLDRSGITVREFWLPGAWAESLPMLLQKPVVVVDDLIQTLDKKVPYFPFDADPDEFEERMLSYVRSQRTEYRNAERLADRYAPRSADEQGNRDGNQEHFVPIDGQKYAGQGGDKLPVSRSGGDAAAKAFRNGRGRIRYRVAKKKISKPVASFWSGMIDTAERIHQIAAQAMRHGVKVRWFDFGEFAKTGHSGGGDRGFLIPLNAVELATPPPPPVGLSFLVRLTPLNEECLVFLSPSCKPHWREPSILFTGDSPLGQGKNYSVSWLRWPMGVSRDVIATAPHHGAETNLAAYSHLNSQARVMLWVRSGGNAGHPGPTYRDIDPSLRICTNCPHAKKPRQAAEIHLLKRPIWYPMRTHGHSCSC